MKSVRMFVVGCLCGVVIATAGAAYASDAFNIVGRAVEGTSDVYVNGAKLESPAIIVDGTSYAPLRAVGETLNMDVSWEDGSVKMVNVIAQKGFAISKAIVEANEAAQQKTSEMEPLLYAITKYETDAPADRTISAEEYAKLKAEVARITAERDVFIREWERLGEEMRKLSEK